MTLQKVDRIHQKDDNTIVVYVQTDSFKPGRQVEVSGYLLQGYRAYAAFNCNMQIPFDAKPGEDVTLPVELPAMDLKKRKDVTVVVRVAEAWPTILEPNPRLMADYQNEGIEGLRAVWTAENSSGKGPGD
jgi:hypothetical protein